MNALFLLVIVIIAVSTFETHCAAFVVVPSVRSFERTTRWSISSSSSADSIVSSIEEASHVLQQWDEKSSPDRVSKEDDNDDLESLRGQLKDAVLLLNTAATTERTADSATGRCMLGICASSATEGIATLKSWVTALSLPRGLLHGMDKDGVPLDLGGTAVYIKYNSGGVYTFEDIRKSGLGFDALWKPGDAMLEEYDGTYRGVYFQVELKDGAFRQYLMPIDVFDEIVVENEGE